MFAMISSLGTGQLSIAKLLSPIFATFSTRCVTFYTYFFGEKEGMLKFSLINFFTKKEDFYVLKKENEKANKWSEIIIAIEDPNVYQVEIVSLFKDPENSKFLLFRLYLKLHTETLLLIK